MVAASAGRGAAATTRCCRTERELHVGWTSDLQQGRHALYRRKGWVEFSQAFRSAAYSQESGSFSRWKEDQVDRRGRLYELSLGGELGRKQRTSSTARLAGRRRRLLRTVEF